MKCENFFCDNYCESKTNNCTRYAGFMFDDCVARKKFRKLVEEKLTSDNTDRHAILLRKWAKWYISIDKVMPPFADTIDLVGSVANSVQ